MSSFNVPNPENFPMTVLSNSTYIAPKIVQGATKVNMVITVDTLDISKGNPTVVFDGIDIQVNVLSIGKINYAVPGNSYPNDYNTIELEVTVNSNAKLGLRNVYVTNAGQQQSTAMPALLNVIQPIN